MELDYRFQARLTDSIAVVAIDGTIDMSTGAIDAEGCALAPPRASARQAPQPDAGSLERLRGAPAPRWVAPPIGRYGPEAQHRSVSATMLSSRHRRERVADVRRAVKRA